MKRRYTGKFKRYTYYNNYYIGKLKPFEISFDDSPFKSVLQTLEDTFAVFAKHKGEIKQ